MKNVWYEQNTVDTPIDTAPINLNEKLLPRAVVK